LHNCIRAWSELLLLLLLLPLQKAPPHIGALEHSPETREENNMAEEISKNFETLQLHAGELSTCWLRDLQYCC
jgi:hypothetical protein